MIKLIDHLESHQATFFQQQQDPEAILMAAFTSGDPKDRAKFDAHWSRNCANPENVNKTILYDGKVAGHIAKFVMEGQTEITYWIGKEFWGKGIATQALDLFLKDLKISPIYARTAFDNLGSMKVLEKCGFVIEGKDRGFANARQAEIDEVIWIRK